MFTSNESHTTKPLQCERSNLPTTTWIKKTTLNRRNVNETSAKKEKTNQNSIRKKKENRLVFCLFRFLGFWLQGKSVHMDFGPCTRKPSKLNGYVGNLIPKLTFKWNREREKVHFILRQSLREKEKISRVIRVLNKNASGRSKRPTDRPIDFGLWDRFNVIHTQSATKISTENT